MDTIRGKVYNSQKTRAFHRKAAMAYMESQLCRDLLHIPSTAPCKFTYTICARPNADLDNYGKCMLDSCTRGLIIESDSQVQEIIARQCQECSST